MSTKSERVNVTLRAIRTSVPEVVGACVVSSDGFIIASQIPGEIDEDIVGGMAASLLGVGERIAHDLMHSEMEQTYVRSPKGYVVINAVGKEAAVILLVTREAKLGLIFLELRRTVTDLAKDLE